MSKNIKDIGKELMGKSLNSFHRKTGLTQLEKNNKMQDGILNGILSQVDDAYIEKTEQSNVIHLDGSGDGVVVVDSIEGNTMVNIIPNGRFKNNKQHWLGGDYFTTFTENDEVVGVKMNGVVEGHHIRTDFLPMKQNTEYTLIYSMKNTSTNNSIWTGVYYIDEFGVQKYLTTDSYDRNNYSSYVQKKIRFTTLQGSHFDLRFYNYCNGDDSNILYIKDVMILEGDWTNKEIPPYFEGLQSSFEEKVNDEGKYEIEILSHSKNILYVKNALSCSVSNWVESIVDDKHPCGNIKIEDNSITVRDNNNYHYLLIPVNLKKNVNYYLNYNLNVPLGNSISFFSDLNTKRIDIKSNSSNGVFSVKQDCKYIGFPINSNINTYKLSDLYINIHDNCGYSEPKYNKIKLLLNSPLHKKNKIEVIDGKLYHVKRMNEIILDGTNNVFQSINLSVNVENHISLLYNPVDRKAQSNGYCDKLKSLPNAETDDKGIFWGRGINIFVPKSELGSLDVDGGNKWLKQNPLKLVYELEEPIYEEVLNEYGEPILLEGYENGTIYIDSTIVPTTTVRYTPKMESFKTYKEVKVRNAINDFDVTENVIPYMMEVDMKLTELEISAYSTYNIKNIRKMEVLDMTSMQERTFKMLERLIRGKSHTKQELIDRVLLYEQAKRITTEQALELNLIIEEVYGA